MVKHLNWDDMKSHEELMIERQSYTEEQVRQLGYPSLEVFHLSDYLSHLAGKWRRTKEQSLVHEYGKTLYQMILKGYDVDDLDFEDHLPERLMPELPPRAILAAILDIYKNVSPTKSGDS
jgi:hypothetical protein